MEISMSRKYSDGKSYKVIAFVYANFFKDEQLRLMKQVVKESRKHNCKVVFFSTLTDFYFNDINDEGEKKIFTAVSAERFDAIVLMSESFKQDEEQLELIQRARKAGVPVFTVDKSFEGCINLAMDYGECFRQIVEHMVLFHGYRRSYFMGGMPGNDYSDEREQVFRDVMKEAEVPEEEYRVYYGYFWEDPCRKAMDQMFRDIEAGLELPEAIICANDSMALEICAYLKERGYQVPKDIAVSGFDGLDMERYHRPRLTTGIYNKDLLIETIFRIVDEGCPDQYLQERIPIYNKMQLGQSCRCNEGDAQNITTEMVALKGEMHSLLKYQGDVNQMVVNTGTMERLTDALSVVPVFMGSLGYKDFWFCANEGFMDEKILDFNVQTSTEDTQDYTSVLEVLHYHNLDTSRAEAGKADIHYWDQVPFGEIIPDLLPQLEENDFILINAVHLRGKSIGYTAVTMDVYNFWFIAYSAFLANFRHLLELQRSQSQLLKMYMEDLLTGLYNRNGFYQKVNQLLEKAEDMDLSIISLDMDGLKQINDTYGHAEGDVALHSLGSIIRNSLNQELAARIGGDEFLIALVGRDIEERAEEIVTCIKQGIQTYNEVSGKDYELHASIGCYTNRVRNHDLDHFLKKADDLMYARKYIHKKERGLIK